MDKNKIMSVMKSVIIIIAIIALVSFLRFEAANLSAVPSEHQDYFRDSNGLPYFTEMDSYYNLRMTQDFISHGHFGSKLLNGTPWDTLSYAPEGRSADYEPMIAYVTSFLYYIANMFSNFSLKEIAFYSAAIIAPIAAISAFIFARRATNNYGGAAAALVLALAPNYFYRTFAGFFDTDMFTVTLPLFMIMFFVESIRSSKLIYRIIFIVLTIATMIVFSLSWVGYTFFVAVLILAIIVYLLLGFVFKLELIQPISKYPNILSWFANQREIFSIAMIGTIGFIGLGIVNGFEKVLNAPMDLIGATQIQAAATTVTNFPNVAISIGELQVPNFLNGGLWGAFLANGGGVINGVGGIVAFFGALTLLVLLALRFFKLHSIKIRDSNNKKPPKGQREAASIVKESKSKGSLTESIIGSIKTKDTLYRNKRETLLYLTLMGVWILLAALAVTQGSRFIQLLMIPMGLCVGLFVGYFTNYVKNSLDDKHMLMAIAVVGSLLTYYPIKQTFDIFYPIYKISATLGTIIPIAILLTTIGISALLIYGFRGFKSPKFGKTAVVILITLALVTPTVISAYQLSESIAPGTSDPMWNSMTWVKHNTTNETVIASWWDFGYLFQIAGDRATLFDGGSQTGIRAFWTGRALTTNDTDLSAAIFTMMAHSGDNATETLDIYTNNDSGKSVEILLNTLTLSPEEAKNKMTDTYNLTVAQADHIVDMTHPETPPPIIVVASQDMIGKAPWWTYFGNWDFAQKNSSGYHYNVAQEPVKLQKIGNDTYQANITNLEQEKIFFKTVITTGAANNTTNATTVAVFENGTTVKTQNNTTYNPFTVNRLIIIEDNIIWKNETVNESGNYTLLVIGDNGTYTSIVMSKELENAMFTKLYILVGFGQTAYEMVRSDSGVSLWKISGVPTLKNETGTANTNT